MRSSSPIVTALFAACLIAPPAGAQWLNEKTPGAPRNPDGTIKLTGPAPRVNGKPDLSGIWQVEAEPRGPGLFGPAREAAGQLLRGATAIGGR